MKNYTAVVGSIFCKFSIALFGVLKLFPTCVQ